MSLGSHDDRPDAAEILEELRRREVQLAEAQSIARIGSWERTASDDVLRWSDELFRSSGWTARRSSSRPTPSSSSCTPTTGPPPQRRTRR